MHYYHYLESLLQKHFNNPSKILQIHALLLTSGFFSPSFPLPTTFSPFAYNCLIQAYLRLGPRHDLTTPLRFFSLMLGQGIQPNHHTFPTLLKSASFLSTGTAIHSQCLRYGLTADAFIGCSLIAFYARHGHVSDAQHVFKEMPHRDLASCNVMLDALCTNGYLVMARRFFERMVIRDAISWTTLVSGLWRNGCPQEAIEVFRRLVWENRQGKAMPMRLGEATLVSVLSACANLPVLEGLATGMAVHGYIVRNEAEVTALLGTALIDMYGKHGKVGCCSNAFTMLRVRKVCTWNALMSALAGNGQEDKALNLFDEMRAQGLLPNQISFVAVLTACARAGLVNIGLRWFDVMASGYGITPLMVHYGCIVDLLGRAGLFREAIEFIVQMPMAADASVWGALLGACKLHGNVELGEWIGQRLIALEPQHSGRYVTLRNLYAEDRQWYEAARMREEMEKAVVKKIVGQSCIGSGGIATC